MGVNKQINELTGWLNWNYIGLVAGILSIVVTAYNISRYYEEIKKVE